MTCLQCGTRMKRRREDYRYDDCGLRGVILKGVEISRCPECGEREVAIPNIEGLHRVLAQAILRKSERLTPDEIRFLRKYLGFSGTDFAAHLGVTPETVSRWENGVAAMGLTAERFLRFMVLTREPLSEYPLTMLKTMGETPARPVRLGMKVREGHWHTQGEMALA